MPIDPVCAVIVTYDPDAGFLDRVRGIARQVDAVVVVDNHSHAQNQLQERCEAAGIVFIANTDNLGVGAALNQGVRWAQARHCKWVLMFDQDSAPTPDCAAELLAIARAPGHAKPVGLVGANYWDEFRGKHLLDPPQTAGQRWVETASVITSGSLLSVDAFRAVGPFREDFFIDSVDIEYALRLRRHGFAVLLSTQPLMNHAIGKPTYHRFLWKRVACSNHSPLRRYYITRNRLALARLYLRQEPRWALRHLRGLFNHCVLTLLYEQHRARKLRAIILGLWHGLRGVTGKLEKPL